MTIHVSGQWQPVSVPGSGLFLVDDQTGGAFCICETLAMAEELFDGGLFSSRRVFAAAVPSAIVPVWNVVLYPLVKGFDQHVSLESVEPFQFDPRLFPEDTPVEAAE